MKRDMDLIRNLLIGIEKDTDLDGKHELHLERPEELGISGHSMQEVAYNLGLLIQAGFVDGGVAYLGDALIAIRSLTWEGHEFLDNIRDPGIWVKTKERISGLSGVGLTVVAAIAQAELKKHFGLS